MPSSLHLGGPAVEFDCVNSMLSGSVVGCDCSKQLNTPRSVRINSNRNRSRWLTSQNACFVRLNATVFEVEKSRLKTDPVNANGNGTRWRVVL